MQRQRFIRMETTRSIRAYFLFFGFFDVLMGYGTIRNEYEVPWISLMGFFVGVWYLCIGLALPTFLSRYLWLVKSLLVAGLCYGFLSVFARILSSEAREFSFGVISRLIFGVFLTLYILDNVDRLARIEKIGSEGNR
jgi:hypothetical protein